MLIGRHNEILTLVKEGEVPMDDEDPSATCRAGCNRLTREDRHVLRWWTSDDGIYRNLLLESEELSDGFPQIPRMRG